MQEEAESPPATEKEKKCVQQVLGSFLYYARAVDSTITEALNAIAEEHANPTQRTLQRVHQILNYMHTHPMAVHNPFLQVRHDFECAF